MKTQCKSFFSVLSSGDIFRANNKASNFIKQFNDLAGRGSTPRIFVKYDKERDGYTFEPNPDFCFHKENSVWNEFLKWEDSPEFKHFFGLTN
jgi:hypothetical protein